MYLRAFHLLRINTINRNPPFLNLIEFHQQIDDRRLPSTGRTDNGNLLPCFCIGRKIMNNRSIWIVTKEYIIKGNIAF